MKTLSFRLRAIGIVAVIVLLRPAHMTAPLGTVDASGHRAVAQAYLEFLHSDAAQSLIAGNFWRLNYAGATAIATIMLALSFLMLFAINLIQAWSRRRFSHA